MYAYLLNCTMHVYLYVCECMNTLYECLYVYIVCIVWMYVYIVLYECIDVYIVMYVCMYLLNCT